eukprot:m.74616 g.74616  ORF g.74616 m.74616 type:complete len:84 (+) comp35898_c0_seq9:1520-1771(+)
MFRLRFQWLPIFLCVGLYSLVGLLIGLIFCTQSGYYTFQLFDTFSANWSLVLVGLLEFIAVAWIYGVERWVFSCVAMAALFLL